MGYKVGKMRVSLIKGDINEAEADAIVNAANSILEHGGGVAEVIVRKGGWEIQEESREYVRRFGPVPAGEVTVTKAGRLKVKYVTAVIRFRLDFKATPNEKSHDCCILFTPWDPDTE